MRLATNIIAFACGLLLVAIFALYSVPAKADHGVQLQKELGAMWDMFPDRRDEIHKAYWEEMDRQIAEAMEGIPIQISNTTAIINIYRQEPRTIVYEYFVRADVVGTVDPQKRKKIMSLAFCSDPDNRKFFEAFQGSYVFVYYENGKDTPFEVLVFEPDVCKLISATGA